MNCVKTHVEDYLTAPEIVLFLGWLLLQPLLVAVTALVVIHRRNPGRKFARTVQATLLLAGLSTAIAILFIAFGPAGLARYLGVQDAPVMWAPFAFIAVALAFPLASWWARRGM